MIVWFNCKITDQRLNPQNIIRYNLKNDNRFDVARYSFASFAPLEPLVSKFIFNIELADEHQGREPEMESWLNSIFPADKLILKWYRADNLEKWKEVQNLIADLDDPLIFPAGNEDHIFIDSNIDVFTRGLELIQNDPDPYATLMTSHWPESIRASHGFDGKITDCGNYVTYNMVNNDAIRVIKRTYFDQYISSVKDPNMLLFRTEHWNSIGIVNNKLYVPTKEQFRHFDGYAHVQVGPDTCPPMEIPQGFFDKAITVKYGFDQRDSACLNINPLAQNLYTTDPVNGTDYKFVDSEFPAFWKPYIKEIITNHECSNDSLEEGYDRYLLEMTRVYVNWHHVGKVFNDSNWPPATWLNNHTKKYLFTEE